LGRTVSLREQLERFGYKDVRFMDVSMDPVTSAVHIRVQMDKHSFTLIAMPVSQTPITWLNSISLEEKGPESEKFLSDLQRIFHFQKWR